jgi:hypothetical protein
MDNAPDPPFDPYRKWLGIPPEEQPPNHYRLLGLKVFESDPEVIAHAADARMTHLKTFQSGPYSSLSQKMLNEIAAAQLCLLSPEKRAAYDEELQQRLDAIPFAVSTPLQPLAEPPMSPPEPPPQPPPVPPPAAEPPPPPSPSVSAGAPVVSSPAYSYLSSRKQRRTSVQLVIAAIVLVVVVAGAAIYFWLPELVGTNP